VIQSQLQTHHLLEVTQILCSKKAVVLVDTEHKAAVFPCGEEGQWYPGLH